jgi:hypothetical protein
MRTHRVTEHRNARKPQHRPTTVMNQSHTESRPSYGHELASRR